MMNRYNLRSRMYPLRKMVKIKTVMIKMVWMAQGQKLKEKNQVADLIVNPNRLGYYDYQTYLRNLNYSSQSLFIIIRFIIFINSYQLILYHVLKSKLIVEDIYYIYWFNRKVNRLYMICNKFHK